MNLLKYLYLVLFCFTVVKAQPEVPKLKSWANDLTNTLTVQQLNTLNYRLKTFQDSTSNQIVALMIQTLNDYPLEDYSYDVATAK